MLVKSTVLKSDQEAKLQKVIDLVPEIISSLDNKEYDEIYGYKIGTDDDVDVNVDVRNEILLKFLIANEYDVDVTKEKIISTLNWRNKFQPLSAAYLEEFESELTDLGAVTYFPENKNNFQVCTWNLYGILKSPKQLFARVCIEDEKNNNDSLPGSQFLRWRVGIMERSLELLDFVDPDNNKIVQVHDYNNVSMLRMDPSIKAVTKKIIPLFGDNYPELLSIKFFANVPSFMSWVFVFFKKLNIIAPETMKKFEILNHCNLSNWLGKDNLPKTYNGGFDTGIGLLYDLEKSIVDKLKPGPYAKKILERTSQSRIEKENLTVE